MFQIEDIDGATLNLAREVTARRTEEDDKKYHTQAQERFLRYKRLIRMAINIYKTRDPLIQGISRYAHRLIFRQSIADAVSRIRSMQEEGDALMVDLTVSHAEVDLCASISSYLKTDPADLPWTMKGLLEHAVSARNLPLTHHHHFCGVPRDPNAESSLRADLANLNALISANELDNEKAPKAINRENVAIVMSALDALPCSFAVDYRKWFGVACAVHDFDSGPIGLALFEKFSSRCPEKAQETDFPEVWASLAGYSGKKVTIRSLFFWAKQEAGWIQPCNWQ
jgi:hypothetical protein